jgi:hypothetical protein
MVQNFAVFRNGEIRLIGGKGCGGIDARARGKSDLQRIDVDTRQSTDLHYIIIG